MSWYVKYLIRNGAQIRNCVDIDNDSVYSDLLLLESAMEKLTNAGLMTDFEINLYRLLDLGMGVRSIGRDLNVMHRTVIIAIDKLCNKLAIYLGGRFTNDGFFDYMKTKYELNEKMESKLYKVIFKTKEDIND